MLNFEYRGIAAGKYIEGEIEAINNTEAAHKLKEKKVIITKLIQSKKKNKKLKKNKHLLLALVVALRLKKY